MKIGHLIIDKNDISRFCILRLTSVDIRMQVFYYSGGFTNNLRVDEDTVKELENIINSR